MSASNFPSLFCIVAIGCVQYHCYVQSNETVTVLQKQCSITEVTPEPLSQRCIGFSATGEAAVSLEVSFSSLMTHDTYEIRQSDHSSHILFDRPESKSERKDLEKGARGSARGKGIESWNHRG